MDPPSAVASVAAKERRPSDKASEALHAIGPETRSFCRGSGLAAGLSRRLLWHAPWSPTRCCAGRPIAAFPRSSKRLPSGGFVRSGLAAGGEGSSQRGHSQVHHRRLPEMSALLKSPGSSSQAKWQCQSWKMPQSPPLSTQLVTAFTTGARHPQSE